MMRAGAISFAAVRPRVRQLTDNEGILGGLLVAPAFLIVLVFFVVPIAMAVAMAFMRIDLTRAEDWTFYGLGNLARVPDDRQVAAAVPRTLYFAGMTTVLTLITGFGAALLLNERFRGQRLLRVVALLPFAIAPIAAGTTWKLIYHFTFGLFNAVLFSLGIIPSYVGWLVDPVLALNAAVFGQMWLMFPLATVIFLARLQGVPEPLYRAAKMDGAGRWRRFIHITLPQMRTTVLIVALLTGIVSVQTFDFIYALTVGGPGDATRVFTLVVFQRSFNELQIGYGAALALLLGLVTALTLLALVGLSRRVRRQGIEAGDK